MLRKGDRSSEVHMISSFPDLVAGTCSSRGFDNSASLAPGRHTSLNLTEPSQLHKALTVLGG